MDYRKKFVVAPGDKVHLGRLDPGFTGGHESEDEARSEIDRDVERLCELQYRLYAEGERDSGALADAAERAAGEYASALG